MSASKVYFPNLNGLRFFAALLVIIHHVEQVKAMLGFPNVWGRSAFVEGIGKLGVVLFFVLSGFLITYLLLTEEQQRGGISIGKFYLRRMLRIWPLYYFILILALGVLPFIGFFSLPGLEQGVVYHHLGAKLAAFVFFLPNLVLAAMGLVPYAAHTWSIGTEEQFYLVWPVLLTVFRKYRILLMSTIWFGYLMIAFFWLSPMSDFVPHKNVFASFWPMFNIDCMAIGGIFAVLLFTRSAWLSILMQPYFFYAILIAVILLLGSGFSISLAVPYLHYELYAILFGIVILNFAANTQLKISLEFPMFNYLGRISYGLYMYHMIGIVIAVKVGGYFANFSNIAVYVMSVAFTILLASLSYRYLESYFLRRKDRLAQVPSSDHA